MFVGLLGEAQSLFRMLVGNHRTIPALPAPLCRAFWPEVLSLWNPSSNSSFESPSHCRRTMLLERPA